MFPVFNTGFTWPHCANHMAQLRHDCQIFLALRTEVLMVVPKGPETIVSYISSHEITYTGGEQKS